MKPFDKAIERIEKLEKFLFKRGWHINGGHLAEVQTKIFQLQRDSIDDQINRLKKYADECQRIINNEVYTLSQKHISQDKRDIQTAKTELKQIEKAIADLRSLWLQLMEE